MTSTISATVSASIQNSSSISNVNWNSILQNPFIQYILSPFVVFSIILFFAYKILNLGELKQKFNQALGDIDELKKDGKKLLSHVDIIKTHLVTSGGLSASLFGPGSPLKLLKAGIKLLEASGFKKIYKDNKDWFIDEVEKYNIKTLADIDEASFKVMEKCRNNSKLANFKELAFQNGVSLDILLRVLSIYLRDEVAKELLK